MSEIDTAPVTLHNPLVFNEDFCLYTEALYNLKKKHPEVFIQLHEYAATLLGLYDAVSETMNPAP